MLDPIFTAYRQAVALHGEKSTEAIRIRNRIVDRNYKLIHKPVAGMTQNWDWDSIRCANQEAAIGLIKAVEYFDPSKGYAFSSFAVPTIKGELRHWIRDRKQKTGFKITRTYIDLHGRIAAMHKRLVALDPAAELDAVALCARRKSFDMDLYNLAMNDYRRFPDLPIALIVMNLREDDKGYVLDDGEWVELQATIEGNTMMQLDDQLVGASTPEAEDWLIDAIHYLNSQQRDAIVHGYLQRPRKVAEELHVKRVAKKLGRSVDGLLRDMSIGLAVVKFEYEKLGKESA